MAILPIFDTEFAVNLFQQVAVDNSSLVLSPLSISLALSLVHLGARGKSEEELTSALAKGSQFSHCKSWYSTLEKKIAPENEHATLDIANKLYVAKKIEILPGYLKEAKQQFEAEPENVDFGDADGAAKIINDFVNKTTRGKIPDVLESKDIDPLTGLSLINSLYFEADWLSPFQAAHEGDFHLTNGQTKTVTFLKQHLSISHVNFGNETVVHLPYKEEHYKLAIVLPNKGFGLPDLVKNLKPRQVHNWLSKKRAEKISLCIPKFEIESSYKLPEQLKKLGVVDIFDRYKADLHGIANEKLYVSDVIHRAKIEVKANGTIASAATAVLDVIVKSNAPQEIKFKADRPFLFILHKKAHPIFIGQYY